MNWVFRATLYGEPVAKGRPRFCRSIGRAYTPKKTREWESEAANRITISWHSYLLDRICAGETSHHCDPPRIPIDQPMRLFIRLHFARPRRLMRKKDIPGPIPHCVKPDIDNVQKSVIDVLQRSGIIFDDSRIWSTFSEKVFCGKVDEEGPRVELWLSGGMP